MNMDIHFSFPFKTTINEWSIKDWPPGFGVQRNGNYIHLVENLSDLLLIFSNIQVWQSMTVLRNATGSSGKFWHIYEDANSCFMIFIDDDGHLRIFIDFFLFKLSCTHFLIY